MDKPPIVPPAEWQAARDELLKAEKEATRTLDAIAARRRRLPMTPVRTDYAFGSPSGTRSLLDLFDGRTQLVTYQFMDRGPDRFCPGCTNMTKHVPPAVVADLAERGVTYANVSNMPIAQIEAYKERMGWTIPFYSSHGTTFADDTGAGQGFMMSVFLRAGDEAFLTYQTTDRGVDRFLFTHNILDLTPYGRQEEWEDSPPGWPQHPTYG